MRTFFGTALALLCLLSLVAWRLQPRPASAGKTPLVWVSDDNPQRKDQIRFFTESNPDCDLHLDPDNSGMQKVIVQSLAGVGPDLFDTNANSLPVVVAADVAWDITDALQAHGIDLKNDVWPGVLPQGVWNGRVYGVPSNAAANALLLNKDAFAKVGLPLPRGPWTWDEFLPVAQKLTQRDERGRTTQFGLIMDWWTWPQFVLQWGGSVYSPDGTRCTLDSPEAIAGIQFLHDLIYKYKVMPSPVEEAAMATQGGWGSGTITQFGGGRGAMALAGRWWLCTLRNREQFPDLHLSTAECPHFQKRVFYAYARSTAINKHSPRREQALQFLLYMAGPLYNRCINNQADALAPFKKYSYTDDYLHNPAFPDEDRNEIWRTTMEHAVPVPPSPFINAQLADRLINKQLDLVRNDQKPVAAALRDAAAAVNAEIKKTLQRDPELRARYEALAK